MIWRPFVELGGVLFYGSVLLWFMLVLAAGILTWRDASRRMTTGRAVGVTLLVVVTVPYGPLIYLLATEPSRRRARVEQAGVESPPNAGWYLSPDDDGTERYWNGTRWTEHRRAVAG